MINETDNVIHQNENYLDQNFSYFYDFEIEFNISVYHLSF